MTEMEDEMKSRKNAELQRRARTLRNNQTLAEKILWSKIRQRKLGVKFRRQYVLEEHIVDFYCVSHGLAIELDGPVHMTQKESDAIREEKLERSGVTVLRFDNQQVFANLDDVIEAIHQALQNAHSNNDSTNQTITQDS